jgi:hypothetical protein
MLAHRSSSNNLPSRRRGGGTEHARKPAVSATESAASYRGTAMPWTPIRARFSRTRPVHSPSRHDRAHFANASRSDETRSRHVPNLTDTFPSGRLAPRRVISSTSSFTSCSTSIFAGGGRGWRGESRSSDEAVRASPGRGDAGADPRPCPKFASRGCKFDLISNRSYPNSSGRRELAVRLRSGP